MLGKHLWGNSRGRLSDVGVEKVMRHILWIFYSTIVGLWGRGGVLGCSYGALTPPEPSSLPCGADSGLWDAVMGQ